MATLTASERKRVRVSTIVKALEEGELKSLKSRSERNNKARDVLVCYQLWRFQPSSFKATQLVSAYLKYKHSVNEDVRGLCCG